MASDTNLSRIEKENSILFGLKWSMVGLLLALLVLSGCSSLFDERVPRYNTVEGPRRVPIYNPGGGAGQPSPQAYQQQAQQAQQAQQIYQRPQQSAPQQPVQPQQTAMPPQRSQQPVAYQQQPVQQETSLWEDVTSVFDSEEEPVRPQPIPLTRQLPATQPLQPLQPQQMPMQTTQQPQRSAMARDVEAQINALEAELDAADARRAQVAREANQEAWPQLAPTNAVQQQPALQTQPIATQPMVQPSAGYAPMKLPPPPPRGSGSGYQPIVAPSNTAAPMPPVITTPPSNVMVNAPVRQDVQPSIDVPLAPDIGITAPQSVNVPLSLIPPSAAGANGDYLPNSRYSGRSYLSYPNR